MYFDDIAVPHFGLELMARHPAKKSPVVGVYHAEMATLPVLLGHARHPADGRRMVHDVAPRVPGAEAGDDVIAVRDVGNALRGGGRDVDGLGKPERRCGQAGGEED